jgi:arylsulfatase A-like enzyme
VADPGIGLALIHVPVPHPPAFYSRARRAYAATGTENYFDSVALADEALGRLRGSLENAGLWDRTAVLVSSDHGWRIEAWRTGADWTPEEESASHGHTLSVPFLLKLHGQTKPVRYDRPFDTVITRKLITAILDGRLTEPDGIAGVIAAASPAAPAASK